MNLPELSNEESALLLESLTAEAFENGMRARKAEIAGNSDSAEFYYQREATGANLHNKIRDILRTQASR
jgi:hypothetical protein